MKGTTLIEILTASIISVIIMSGVLTYITSSSKLNERVVLQSKAHGVMSLATRIIEEAIKEGASVDVSADSSALNVFDKAGNLDVTFKIVDDKLYKTEAGGSDSEIITFSEATFEGSFFQLYEKRFAEYRLKLILLDGKEIKSETELINRIKCRNAYIW